MRVPHFRCNPMCRVGPHARRSPLARAHRLALCAACVRSLHLGRPLGAPREAMTKTNARSPRRSGVHPHTQSTDPLRVGAHPLRASHPPLLSFTRPASTAQRSHRPPTGMPTGEASRRAQGRGPGPCPGPKVARPLGSRPLGSTRCTLADGTAARAARSRSWCTRREAPDEQH